MAPSCARISDKFVSGVGNEWRPCVRDQSHSLVRHPLNQAGADPFSIVIMIRLHRAFDPDMLQQLRRDAAVFHRYDVRLAKNRGSTWT